MKNQWSCNNCGYTFAAEQVPNKCPSCHQECTFVNVTCYTPECGGPESGNVDPRLIRSPKPDKANH
jgi:rubredoxin